MYNFQDELRRALLKYALLPALLLALISLLLIGASWHHYVLTGNYAARQGAASRIETMLVDSEEIMRQLENRINTSPRPLTDQVEETEARAALYGVIYETVNQSDLPWEFYLTDREGHLLLGSRDQLPLNLQDGNWGLMQRLRQQGEPVAEFVRSGQHQQDFIWGRALYQKGVLQGYFLLAVPGETMLLPRKNPGVILTITDAFYNQAASTGTAPADEQGKLLPLVCGRGGGLAEVEQEIYYVTQSQLPQGVRVLALTPVRSLLVRYLMGGFLLVILLGVLVPVIFWSVQRESRLRAQTVEKLTSKAEMRQLVSQFNPHFLFNTLENIKYMVKLNPAVAVKMVMALSALLRYSINNSLQQVRLEDDLDYVRRYMEIQQYRFGKRLDFQEDIAPEVRECEIPKLLFQPALENAIKYGADKSGVRHIRLQVALQGNLLQVNIWDSGPGFSPEALADFTRMQQEEENATEHTGLFNIHRRIQLLYGREYGVTIREEQGQTCVGICLPRRNIKEEKA